MIMPTMRKSSASCGLLFDSLLEVDSLLEAVVFAADEDPAAAASCTVSSLRK